MRAASFARRFIGPRVSFHFCRHKRRECAATVSADEARYLVGVLLQGSPTRPAGWNFHVSPKPIFAMGCVSAGSRLIRWSFQITSGLDRSAHSQCTGPQSGLDAGCRSAAIRSVCKSGPSSSQICEWRHGSAIGSRIRPASITYRGSADFDAYASGSIVGRILRRGRRSLRTADYRFSRKCHQRFRTYRPRCRQDRDQHGRRSEGRADRPQGQVWRNARAANDLCRRSPVGDLIERDTARLCETDHYQIHSGTPGCSGDKGTLSLNRHKIVRRARCNRSRMSSPREPRFIAISISSCPLAIYSRRRSTKNATCTVHNLGRIL